MLVNALFNSTMEMWTISNSVTRAPQYVQSPAVAWSDARATRNLYWDVKFNKTDVQFTT